MYVYMSFICRSIDSSWAGAQVQSARSQSSVAKLTATEDHNKAVSSGPGGITALVISQLLWLPVQDQVDQPSNMDGRGGFDTYLAFNSWWFREEESIFFKCINLGRWVMIRWMVPHPGVDG